MPQLHLYVGEDVAAAVKGRARARGLSVSRYLAALVVTHNTRELSRVSGLQIEDWETP